MTQFVYGGPERYAHQRTSSTAESFELRIQRMPTCWIWTGATNEGTARPGHAYGTIWLQDEKRNELVHRYAYERWVGPLVDGMQIDHTCKVKLCANPAHLEQVTGSVNQQRTLTNTCRRGHPRVPGNYRITKTGSHQCYVCARMTKKTKRSARG